MKTAKERVVNILTDELDVITEGKIHTIADRVVTELQLNINGIASSTGFSPTQEANKAYKSLNPAAKKLTESQENTYILNVYVALTDRIMYAVEKQMPYIPLKEWLSELDDAGITVKRTKEQQQTVERLKRELVRLANLFQYFATSETDFFMYTENAPVQ